MKPKISAFSYSKWKWVIQGNIVAGIFFSHKTKSKGPCKDISNLSCHLTPVHQYLNLPQYRSQRRDVSQWLWGVFYFPVVWFYG